MTENIAGTDTGPPTGLTVDCALRCGAFALAARFDVPAGVTVLLGPSGAGKSLTLQAIAGLLTPDAGRIALGGRALLDHAVGVNLPARVRRVGYVPQFSALFPHLSVGENVAYGLPSRHRGWWRPGRPALEREKEAARVEDLLALVRLPGFAARMPGTLSGGQARRVALARALAAEPHALLLDEPLSALDAPTRAALRTDLRAVLATSGIPALFVTHDLDEARALADRLVVLIAGRVVASGPLTDILAAPPTAEAALLLGWENVLPLAGIEHDGASLRATLPGGQTLALPAASVEPAQAGFAAADHLAANSFARASLALRADRLHIEPADASSATKPSNVLSGRLLDLTDYGPYLALSVALAGDEDGMPLRLTCSPREGAAHGLAPGASMHVCVPPEAARVVLQG